MKTAEGLTRLSGSFESVVIICGIIGCSIKRNPVSLPKMYLMDHYKKPVEVRWSDLDPNFHVRHSVYYDWGAFVRMCFLNENGLSAQVLMQNNLGPILFREECVFKREIHFSDTVTISLSLKQCSSTYSRWTMYHEIIKNEDTVAAIITVDGAWMDTARRKLTVPPEIVAPTFEILPRAEDFKWIERKTP